MSYKPSHTIPDDEQFRRLKHANKVLDKLSDYLYSAPGTPAPDDD